MAEEYLSTDPNAGLEDQYISTDPNAGLEQKPEGGIVANALAGAGDVIKGFAQQLVPDLSFKNLASVAYGPINAQITGYHALKSIVDTAEQVQEAEKTPPFSRERFGAGFNVVGQLGLLAAGARAPKLSEIAGLEKPVTPEAMPQTPEPLVSEVAAQGNQARTTFQDIAPDDLTIYHSSPKKFEAFTGTGTETGLGGRAFYFSGKPEPAYGENVVPITVPRDKILDLSQPNIPFRNDAEIRKAGYEGTFNPETGEYTVYDPNKFIKPSEPVPQPEQPIKPIHKMTREEYGDEVAKGNILDSIYRYGEPRTKHPFYATDIMYADILGSSGELTGQHGIQPKNPLKVESMPEASEKLFGKNIYPSGPKAKIGEVSEKSKAILEADNKIGDAAEKSGYDAIVTPREVQIIDKSLLHEPEPTTFNEQQGYYEQRGEPLPEGIGYDYAIERSKTKKPAPVPVAPTTAEPVPKTEEVIPPTEPPPVPTEFATDNPPVSRFANRFVEERVKSGEIGEIAPGQGISTPELVQRGLQMPPERVNEAVSRLVQGGDIPVDDAAAIRGEEARLSQRSAQLSKVADADPSNIEAKKAANDAFKDLTDFHNGPVAQLKQNWHQQGKLMQGEIPVDLSTTNGLREQWLRDVGEMPPERMEPIFKKTAEKVNKSITEDNGSRANLRNEIDKATARRKLPTVEEVQNSIMDRMKVEPCPT